MKRILVFVLAFLLFPSFSTADPQLDREPGVQPSATRGIQGAAGMIPIETTPAVGAGGATELKQDDAIAQLILILAKIASDPSTETTLALLEGKDFATQVTVAAILAKISADPSTETTVAAILAKLSSDPSTETTVAAILAKLSADPSTETTAAAILAKLSSDPSTETTLALLEGKDFATQVTAAAILAKLSADPSTETKQDDLNALIVIIDAVLDLMKTALDNILLDTTEIIANTATATVGANGTVTITTSATQIRPANAGRIALLVHNAENVIVFTGFTGVTVASGTPLSKSTTDADGKGGNITYKSTPAIFGIVVSGTADVRWTEESK